MSTALVLFAVGDAAPVLDSGDHVLVLAPWVVKIIVGSLLPLAVAALAHSTAPDVVRRVLGIAVAGVATLLERATTLPDGSSVFDRALLVDWWHTLAISLVAYLAAWQGARINSRVLPSVGLGRSTT